MTTQTILHEYKLKLREELELFLHYWMEHAPDIVHGGFYGKIDEANRVYPEAPKTILSHSRILWTFSAAFNETHNSEYLSIAEIAYDFIMDHFIDSQFAGLYWSVDYKGTKLDDNKHITAMACCLNALCEYYKATGITAVLATATGLFGLIEEHYYDHKHKGYFKAFTHDWKLLKYDESSSEKMMQKTALDHLHLIEGYTNLYKIWNNSRLKGQLENLLEIFAHHIVDETNHLTLFFERDWTDQPGSNSYGLNMEAAWLLPAAATVIHHPGWMFAIKSMAVKIAETSTGGFDNDGGLNNSSEKSICTNEKFCWVQAEAMIGFFSAWHVSGDEKYLHHSIKSWEFTNRSMNDHPNSKWAITQPDFLTTGTDTFSNSWDCPFHHFRACIELIHRIEPVFDLPD